jgi:hypothetical protein
MRGAKEWFDSILSDQLVFRRATGIAVTESACLCGLDDPSAFTSRKTEKINIIGLEDVRALVILIVRTQKSDKSEYPSQHLSVLTAESVVNA